MASYLPGIRIGASVNNVYIVWTEFTGQYKDQIRPCQIGCDHETVKH